MTKDSLSSDKLGSTVFAPVKMDFVGNIKVSVTACEDVTAHMLVAYDKRVIFIEPIIVSLTLPFLVVLNMTTWGRLMPLFLCQEASSLECWQCKQVTTS